MGILRAHTGAIGCIGIQLTNVAAVRVCELLCMHVVCSMHPCMHVWNGLMYPTTFGVWSNVTIEEVWLASTVSSEPCQVDLIVQV